MTTNMKINWDRHFLQTQTDRHFNTAVKLNFSCKVHEILFHAVKWRKQEVRRRQKKRKNIHIFVDAATLTNESNERLQHKKVETIFISLSSRKKTHALNLSSIFTFKFNCNAKKWKQQKKTPT